MHQPLSNCRFPGTASPIHGDNYEDSQFGPKAFYLLENDVLGNIHSPVTLLGHS